jgi:hypothetical protein
MRAPFCLTLLAALLLSSSSNAAKLCEEGTISSASGVIEELERFTFENRPHWWLIPDKVVSDCEFVLAVVDTTLPAACKKGRKFKTKGTITHDVGRPEAAMLVALKELSCS